MAAQDHHSEDLSAHLDGTIASLAALRESHRRGEPPLQRFASGTTEKLSRPTTVLGLTVVVLGWIVLNVLLPREGHAALDPPPFFWLGGALSLISVYMLFLVLASQRNESQLDRRRELLSLELAVRAEEKMAKVIELLQELRRDMPQVPDRVDDEAEAMSKPAKPDSVIEVLGQKPADMGEDRRPRRN